jgi:hypothetical protein
MHEPARVRGSLKIVCQAAEMTAEKEDVERTRSSWASLFPISTFASSKAGCIQAPPSTGRPVCAYAMQERWWGERGAGGEGRGEGQGSWLVQGGFYVANAQWRKSVRCRPRVVGCSHMMG